MNQICIIITILLDPKTAEEEKHLRVPSPRIELINHTTIRYIMRIDNKSKHQTNKQNESKAIAWTNKNTQKSENKIEQM